MLGPFLFIIVLQAPSKEIRSRYPEELIYADDLVLLRHSLDGLKGRTEAWKGAMESIGLRVNIKKIEMR